MTVDWKPIPGFSRYRIDREGNIESCVQGSSWRRMKQSISHHGYRVLNLRSDDGTVKLKRVHRLVCEAFNGPAPEGKDFVNHKDADKLNNHFKNLEWMTSGENTRHAAALGLNPVKATVNVIVHNLTTNKVDPFEFRQDVIRYFGLNEFRLEKLLAGYPHLVYRHGDCLYRLEPIVNEDVKCVTANGIRAKNYLTGQEFTAESVRLASILSGVNRFRLDKYLKRGTITSGFVFKRTEDLSPWPEYTVQEAHASFPNNL